MANKEFSNSPKNRRLWNTGVIAVVFAGLALVYLDPGFAEAGMKGNRSGLTLSGPQSTPSASTAAPLPKGPYFGQRLPGEIPELFAPEFLSARFGFVARIAFAPDGNECFFTVTDAAYAHPKIYGSRKVGDTWSEPAIPAFADPQWINHEPFFSRDGGKITFTSNRQTQSVTNKRDFWVTERTLNGWSEPKRLPPPINSDHTEFFYSQTADGTAYFCSDRPNGIGALDIYRVRPGAEPTAPAENLGAPVNAKYYNGDPCIAPDGRFLVFGTVRPEGRGGMDLYVSFRDGPNGWTVPVSLGEGFNTPANEYAPSFSPDGRFLFFARHDGQQAKLYWVKMSVLDRFRAKASSLAPKPAEPLKSTGATGDGQVKGAYLGQKPPGDTLEVFAPGIVSLEDRLEAYPTFSADGRELFFSVVNAAWTAGEILYTRLKDGVWSKPEKAPFSAGSSINWESSLSPDGKQLFFASNRPPSSAAAIDLWMVERVAETAWSDPVRLPAPINSAADDGSACVTNDGTLYFHSSRGGGIGGSELYQARLIDHANARVDSLGGVIKTGPKESEPYMAPDESYLIFISQTRPGGKGGWDLWISFRKTDGLWTAPVNMGPEINTAADEYGPRVTPDGKYLFLTREVRGRSMDIYWASARIIERLRANHG